jgi:hypothetical protein
MTSECFHMTTYVTTRAPSRNAFDPQKNFRPKRAHLPLPISGPKSGSTFGSPSGSPSGPTAPLTVTPASARVPQPSSDDQHKEIVDSASLLHGAPVPPRWLYPRQLSSVVPTGVWRSELPHHHFLRSPAGAIDAAQRIVAAFKMMPSWLTYNRHRDIDLLIAEERWLAWMTANKAGADHLRGSRLTRGLEAAARRAGHSVDGR